jgi:manganese-dependent inorganic pyrophosphatase
MIYVVGHEFPNTDIDSVFSSILLSNFIKEYYKLNSKPICLNRKNDYIFSILKKLKISYPKKYKVKSNDLFALVDHNNLDQSLNNLKLNNKIFAIVDHHKDENLNYLKFKIIKKYGCAATIIYELYTKYNIKITSKFAKLFVYAIIADTINLLLGTTTKKDEFVLNQIYTKFNIKSKEKIFKEIYNLNLQNKKKINFLLNEGLKIFNFKKYKIYISDINIDSKFSKKKAILDYLNIKKKNCDLYCVSFRNLQNLSTEIYYFGKLSSYFNNKTYSVLKSRKNFIYPYIENKIKKIN